jgi:hypothetical protein
MANSAPINQPKFDQRIYSLAYPLQGSQYGNLKRGFMIWEKPIQGYSSEATMHFLYNPSTVSAQYVMADSSVGASLLFPTGFNNTNLRVPLNQTVEWALLFDRTYELWQQYDSSGNSTQKVGSDKNNPAVVGVLADIIQMEQFTGMQVGYSSGNSSTPTATSTSLTGNQGIIQMIPSYVYFGDSNNLWYYGYISEWDLTVTHWTQYMVPMRCVINVTWTMLPTPQSTNSGSQSNTNWTSTPSTRPGSSGIRVIP